jgi:hypothetical protein
LKSQPHRALRLGKLSPRLETKGHYGAGETRSIEADHEPGIAKTDFGDQLLEAVTLDTARARFAEILVDDLHTLMRPSQADGAIDQAVLQLR